MATLLHSRRNQRGAILVVSLLLLLVMTALALTASQTTRLQERMAGNARDLDLAFQGAEAGLRDAEQRLQSEIDAGGMTFMPLCATPADCAAVARPSTPIDYQHSDDDWWEDNAVQYGTADAQELDGLVADPVHRAELWTNFSDSLTDGAKPGQQTGMAYYVATSRSYGGTQTAEVVLQSVYAYPYVE